MKGSSWATVVLIAIVATIVAALTVNAVLGDPNDESVSINYMDIIQPTVSDPDPEVFNKEAVNPTVEVYVGNCPAGEVWDEARRECVEEEAQGDEAENQETGVTED